MPRWVSAFSPPSGHSLPLLVPCDPFLLGAHPVTDISGKASLFLLQILTTPFLSIYSTVFSPVLPHMLSAFLLAVSPADLQLFQVLLPSALTPTPRSTYRSSYSCCSLSPSSLTCSPLPMPGSTLSEAYLLVCGGIFSRFHVVK